MHQSEFPSLLRGLTRKERRTGEEGEKERRTGKMKHEFE
jgi:hypothetical protein